MNIMKNKISIKLPANEHWLTLINEIVRHYARLHEFAKKTEDDLTQSLLEACEAFLMSSQEVKVSDEYKIFFDFHNDAVIAGLIYNGKIPLNPHETEDYEVPETGSDLDNINLDTLWLHIIRRRMDRVFFSVRGSQHVLQMIKYRREVGKERQQWVMGLSPALRDELRIEYIYSEDGTIPAGCIIQDPDSESMLKLGPSEAFMIRNMNGENTCHDIYMDHIVQIGMISPQRITLLYEKIETAKVLADPSQKQENRRLKRVLRKVINPSFSIPRPDDAITAVYRLTRFLFNPIGFLLLVLIGFSGIYPLINHYDQFINTVSNLENFFLSHPEAIIILYFLFLVVAVIHEFAHGLVCKHYGGKVNRLGLMFYLGTFMFFCDTSSAWNFPKRSQRFLVSFAGPLTTFAIWGAALLAAAASVNTGAIWQPIWVCLSILCIVILILNFNPFIKMDAYYMLMDIANIPNLRSRSFKFIKDKLFGRFISIQDKEEGLNARTKSLFWIYGIIGLAATLIFTLLPLVKFSYMLATESSQQGKLLLGFLIILLFIFRLGFQGYQKFRSIRHRTYKLK
jgi:putative peptide zinc metalloprotease protein